MSVTSVSPRRPPTGLLIVAAEHPSLDGEVDRFLDDLRSERRSFGPRAAANPKPFPSLIDGLASTAGLRLAVVECGRVVALSRVDESGRFQVAVVADRRGRHIGRTLATATVERARELGYRRLVMRSSRRSAASLAMAAALRCVVIDQGRGRVELLIELDDDSRSA